MSERGVAAMTLAALVLLAGCASQPHEGYTTADSRRLPRLQSGMHLRVLPWVEARDCEGPDCEARAIVWGKPKDGSASFSALERSFVNEGWKKGKSGSTGIVLMCKGEDSVAFAAPADYGSIAPPDIAKMVGLPQAVAVLDMSPTPC